MEKGARYASDQLAVAPVLTNEARSKGWPMTEAEWLATEKPLDMLREYPAAWDVRKARLFWCACLRRNWAGLTDEEIRHLVQETEDQSEADMDWLPREFPYLFNQYQAANSGNGKFRYYWAIRGFFGVPPDSLIRSVELLAPMTARMALINAGRAPWSADCAKLLAETEATEKERQCHLLREVFGNPFRKVKLDTRCRTDTALALARQMYDSRDFSAMPILADTFEEVGCDSDDILDHCRGAVPHVRGCWVVDLVLGKS